MMEPVFIRKARYLLVMDEAGNVVEDCSVRVEDGVIAEVGRDIVQQRGDEVIEGSGCILMPGLVNAHTHSSMVALRGLNDDAPLEDWLRSMWKAEERLNGRAARIASELAFMEMVRSGTTACLDMYEAWEAARAAVDIGIKMGNGPALISVFGSPGERLADARNFIHEFRGSDLISPVVNLHSIYTNDPETIAKAADLARKEDVLLHLHCSETRKEVFGNRSERGRLAVEELQIQDAIFERTVLAHLGWAASWEFERIMEQDAMMVHCPTSNSKLGTGGFFPYADLKEKGAVVGLGTDSAASNNSLDMFREMRSMALTQKGQYWDPHCVSARDVLVCATVNGNRILGIDAGEIDVGKKADLTLVGINPSIMPLRRDNIESALVYSATGSLVEATLVDGEQVYNRGKLADSSDYMERAASLHEELSDMMEYP